jgi:hypothetical protein
MRSFAPQRTQTRCGGSCGVPQAVHFEPTKPYFHAAARSIGGPAGRDGSGRRGGSVGRISRHLRYVP